MATKREREREQWKSARAASLEHFKKKRVEASLLSNSAQLRIDDNKLITADTTDTEGTWLWNESANETDSDTEEEGNGDIDEIGLEGDESRTEEAVGPKVHKVKLRWNKKGQDRTQMRH